MGIGSRVDHPKFGLGVVVNVESDFYKIYFSSLDEVKSIGKDYDGLTITEEVVAPAPAIEIRDIEKAVEKIFEKYMDDRSIVALGNKWIGGKVAIHAGSEDLQGKEIPIDTFFHKIVMVRDRLRVLEQNINSHAKLDAEDKVHLQQYITRAYGSLTTFNVLFQSKEDQFKGAGS